MNRICMLLRFCGRFGCELREIAAGVYGIGGASSLGVVELEDEDERDCNTAKIATNNRTDALHDSS